MKTTFLRIFLSFWLAMGLIVATSIVISVTVAYQRLQDLQSIEAGDLADGARASVDRGGDAGLRKWIDETEREHLGLNVFVIDSQGMDVLERPFPSRVQRLVGRMTRNGILGGENGKPAYDPMRIASQIATADGRIFTVVTAYTDWLPFAVLKTADVNLALLLIAFLFSGLVCGWLARYVAAPVARLQSVARSVAAGDLDAHVDEEIMRRDDEIGTLARDFDRMSKYLRSLITSKESLLTDVSNELRSPLARLQVALGLARRNGKDLPRQLRRIELEVARLDVLIGQILQLSQLTMGMPTLRRERIDFHALVKYIVDDAQVEASTFGKRVSLSGAAAILEGNSQLLHSAVDNVLRNAIEFTAVDTAVEISLGSTKGWCTLRIADHGPGVPDTDLTRIFDAFYRVPTARDRHSGGPGLGLAITSRVMILHEGSVTASNLPTGGLAVDIRLPALSG